MYRLFICLTLNFIFASEKRKKCCQNRVYSLPWCEDEGENEQLTFPRLLLIASREKIFTTKASARAGCKREHDQ